LPQLLPSASLARRWRSRTATITAMTGGMITTTIIGTIAARCLAHRSRLHRPQVSPLRRRQAALPSRHRPIRASPNACINSRISVNTSARSP
jgi:pyruvate/2-oxoglutarate dehydrogenase complex dihydrolipoamide acyltransferase (E2) component